MRGRQLVWSDAKIAKLCREFVTVADEAYMLYPEDDWNLRRVADTPQHRFFRRYGESMPQGDWNHPGTKQGLYMIGPDGDYLEGRFAVNGMPEDVVERLERALDRWQQLRKQKRYANRPVPQVRSTLPPELERREFVLRVHARDLPRDGGQQCVRFDPKRHRDAAWLDFTRWAWNENWLAVDDWRALVPDGDREQQVDPALVQRIAREVLIDNVRGQAGSWPESALRTARLSMRRSKPQQGSVRIVYTGEVDLDDGERAIRAVLYGEAELDTKQQDLQRFELVALGMRTGAHQFNQRSEDPGPAPIGFALTRWREPSGGASERKQRQR